MPLTDASPASIYEHAARDGLEYRDGALFVPESGLWLDSTRSRPCAFVSHAHRDHIARHGTAVLSAATAAIYRYRAGRSTMIELPFHSPTPRGSTGIELAPAGHILGSAQIRIVRDNGMRIVYTGDFKLRGHGYTEPGEALAADILVMEATYGDPRWRFPEPNVVADMLRDSVRAALERGATPIVLAYPLGKAQTALLILAGSGVRVQVHQHVLPYVDIYRRHGVQFGDFQPFDVKSASGSVVLAPAGAQRGQLPASLPRPHTIMLTGWGLDPQAKYRYGVDEMIPMSDHADFAELMEYVERSAPRRVYTVHGAPDFARRLREIGIEAYHLPSHQPSLFDG